MLTTSVTSHQWIFRARICALIYQYSYMVNKNNGKKFKDYVSSKEQVTRDDRSSLLYYD